MGLKQQPYQAWWGGLEPPPGHDPLHGELVGMTCVVNGWRFDWTPDHPDHIAVLSPDGHTAVDLIPITNPPPTLGEFARRADTWTPKDRP